MKKLNELKRREIRRELSNGIIVYNPNAEQRKAILEIIANNIKDSVIDIDARNLLLGVMPILTNIEIPSDMSEDSIEQVLNDPDEVLIIVFDEIKEILKVLIDRAVKVIDEMKGMPKDKLEKLISAYNENQLTPEEKELRELEEKTKALKEKLNKK